MVGIEAPVFSAENVMLFDRQVWAEVIEAQLEFLRHRPLLWQVYSEEVWGAAYLQGLFLGECWEAEVEKRQMNLAADDEQRKIALERGVIEIADMALYLITTDALASNKILDSSFKVMMGNLDTLGAYMDDFGVEVSDLVGQALAKNKLNEVRFPVEAFRLTGDLQHDTYKRLEANLKCLRQLRREIPMEKVSSRWGGWLMIDENGYVKGMREGWEQASLVGAGRHLGGLEGRQRRSLVNAKSMSRGTSIPEAVLTGYVSGLGLVLDLGCGPGDEAYRLAGVTAENGRVLAMDLNIGFLKAAAGRDLIFSVKPLFVGGDLTHLPVAGEHVDAVCVSGVLCNLVGKQLDQALGEMQRVIRPGGLVLVAECLGAGDNQTTGAVKEKMDWGDEEYLRWSEKWQRRYRHNFGLGLPRGTFVVLPKMLAKLEYAGIGWLRLMIGLGLAERFARHFDRSDLVGRFGDYGFVVERIENTCWLTRSGKPIKGMVVVLRKTSSD